MSHEIQKIRVRVPGVDEELEARVEQLGPLMAMAIGLTLTKHDHVVDESAGISTQDRAEWLVKAVETLMGGNKSSIDTLTAHTFFRGSRFASAGSGIEKLIGVGNQKLRDLEQFMEYGTGDAALQVAGVVQEFDIGRKRPGVDLAMARLVGMAGVFAGQLEAMRTNLGGVTTFLNGMTAHSTDRRVLDAGQRAAISVGMMREQIGLRLGKLRRPAGSTGPKDMFDYMADVRARLTTQQVTRVQI